VRARLVALLGVFVMVTIVAPGSASGIPRREHRPLRPITLALPGGFVPAVVRAQTPEGYIVRLRAPSVAERRLSGRVSGQAAVADVRVGQQDVIRAVQGLGGRVGMRFTRLVNGFSATMTPADAARVATLPGVTSVTPNLILYPALESSVPFIQAPKVWHQFGSRGAGIVVAVIDTGVDYTHKDLGGSGNVADFQNNDPTIIEPGTFPTAKVIGGWDLVGDQGYDPNDPAHDTPSPDPDPLPNLRNEGGHGTHVAGICCGTGVPGSVGKGVAPAAKILALKVFDQGQTSSAIVIQAIERAVDPNQDGDLSDHADVINMSLGADWSTDLPEWEAVHAATEAGVVVVASAGNSSHQASYGPAYITGGPSSAPDAISVAASIDLLSGNAITTRPAIQFPLSGTVRPQDWGGSLDADLTARIVDARQYAPPGDPSGQPDGSDRELCDSTPTGHPFSGKIVLVFKASTDFGDCLADQKALHAQRAGAAAVVLWDGEDRLLPILWTTGASAASVTIPVVDFARDDAAALGAALSPHAPGSYNTVSMTATLHATPSTLPAFADRMSDFTSEGPSRTNNALKPDISAPGRAIDSAAAGTGTGSVSMDGTSMASPHVAGVAALLVALHPGWAPADVKAAIMNHGVQKMRYNDGSGPVSATVMGSGRIDAFSSVNTQTLAEPGSVSFGLRAVPRLTRITRDVTVRNLDAHPHNYTVASTVRYTDLSDGFASVKVSVDGGPYAASRGFSIGGHGTAAVRLKLILDPSAVSTAEQLYGWYYFNPNVDGNLAFHRLGANGEFFHVPWHVSGLAASATRLSATNLNLRTGARPLAVIERGAGRSFADLFLLGARSPKTSGGEEDVALIGARSFAGGSINGVASGVPTGVDAFAGLTWREFLTAFDEPTEPVEFAVRTYGNRSTVDSQEVDILVDLGADGVFADPDIGADTLLVKFPGGGEFFGGIVCQFDLPSTFDACDHEYFVDDSAYNSSLTGIVADARSLGLSNAVHTLSYSVTVCNVSNFDGESLCDFAGGFSNATGTYRPTLDVTNPALDLSRWSCRGFWGNKSDCGASAPVTVSVGAAAPGGDPSILALFPNNTPGAQSAVVTTST
jgi:subtilisin family serine protease